MTQSEWEQTGFPHHPLPTEVKGVVNVEVWYQKIEQLLAGAEAPHGLIRIMQDIAQQLSTMDIRDIPIIVGEITDNFGVMNDDNKRNNSLEMVERRVFLTCWTWRSHDSCHCLLSTGDHKERVISF